MLQSIAYLLLPLDFSIESDVGDVMADCCFSGMLSRARILSAVLGFSQWCWLCNATKHGLSMLP